MAIPIACEMTYIKVLKYGYTMEQTKKCSPKPETA